MYFEIKTFSGIRSVSQVDQLVGSIFRLGWSEDDFYYIVFFDDSEGMPDSPNSPQGKYETRLFKQFENVILPINLHIVYAVTLEDGSAFTTELELGPKKSLLSFNTDM